MDSVFINTHGGKELKVAGNPHIAAGFFDQNLQLIKGAFISKAMKQGTIANDYNYGIYTVKKQNFIWEARYQSEQSTEQFFFEAANRIRQPFTLYNNMRNENPTVNAGGGFYLLSIKAPPSFDLFQARVKKYTETHEDYDRLNDNCAHALLESLSISIPFRYGLDTQTAFGLVMNYFGLNHPITLIDCLKDPITLGWEESIKLQNIHASNNKILLDNAKNRLGIT